MLTDLNWIAPGKPFPPRDEEKRIKKYKDDKYMFIGEYKEVFGQYFADRAISLRMRDINVETIINYPQLLTKKTADFVCGEPPLIDIGDYTDILQDELDYMNFAHTLYESIMDVSRFGNAVIKTLDDRVSIVPPEYWYPIVDPFDRKKINQQVIAFVADRTIYVEIHDSGRYEKRLYEAKKMRGDNQSLEFGDMLGEPEVFNTNIDENAVQVLSNVTSSDSLYGVSDYNIIKDTLKQLLWRIFCVERILDKHSAPSMVGPGTMLEQDQITGLPLIKPGNFFKRDSSDTPMPQYLTWDGNLQAVQWEIEWLTNQMYTLSEMGAAFLEGAGKGEVNSGRALRLRMTSPLIKAQRLVGINDQTVKRIVRNLALSRGINIEIKDISTTWRDGIPNDQIEDCDLYERATGGKPFMSQFTAVKRFNNLDDEAANEELAAIEGEHSFIFNPMELNNEQNRQTNTGVQESAGRNNGGDREEPERDGGRV